MGRKVYEFMAKQFNETIEEYRSCSWCGNEFPIFSGDIDFLDKLSPVIAGEKLYLPKPLRCRNCRQMHRLMFRNENKLYKSKSKKSGDPLISVYTPDSELYIHSWKEYYDSNEFENLLDNYDIEDFNKTYKQLFFKVPHINLQNGSDMENSEYNNLCGGLKNCYLCHDCGGNDTSLYCGFVGSNSANLIDCFDAIRINNSFYLVGAKDASKSYYCMSCENIYNCYYCFNSSNLNSCIGCYGLRNAKYMIFNEQVSKEEFEEFQKKYFNGTHSSLSEFSKLFVKFSKTLVYPESTLYNVENVIGDNIAHARDIFESRFTYSAENVRYGFFATELNNCMDVDYTIIDSERCYNSITIIKSQKLICCVGMGASINCMYCNFCSSCQDCFGCIGITNKQYCIFNKQYSKIDYEINIKLIIGSMREQGIWGEFFDPDLTPFPYNDSVANDFFPIKEVKLQATGYKSQANGRGTVTVLEENKFVSKAKLNMGVNDIDIKWRTDDNPINIPDGIKTIIADDLPNVSELQVASSKLQDVLEKAVICEKSGRPFRIMKVELDFYIKHNIPLPKKHPDIRHLEKLKMRPFAKLYLRNCDKCNKEILTVHHENSGKTINCQKCYEKDNY